jgi:hypothetical protein
MKSSIFKQLRGFSSLMSNSKNYWNNTINELGENICGCGFTDIKNEENNNEKEDIDNLDKMFIDKRDNKNKNENEIEKNKILEKEENNGNITFYIYLIMRIIFIIN